MKKVHVNRTEMWSKKEKISLIGVGLFLAILAITSLTVIIQKDLKKLNAYKVYIGKEVPHNYVCMVSKEIKIDPIHSLIVNGKTYWGCCLGCIAKLKHNINNVRYSIDPVSKQKISKADSYIRINPRNKRQGKFFASEDTYKKFINSLSYRKENNNE